MAVPDEISILFARLEQADVSWRTVPTLKGDYNKDIRDVNP